MRLRVGADNACCFSSVHSWHQNVHEDQVGFFFDGFLYTIFTIFGSDDRKPQGLHLHGEDLKHIRMIFYNEGFFRTDLIHRNFYSHLFTL